MGFTDEIKSHASLLIGLTLTLIFLLALVNLIGSYEKTSEKVISQAHKSESLLSNGNISISIKKPYLEITSQKVYENDIIINSNKAYNLKFVIVSDSSNIYFENGGQELTKPVLGQIKIPIYVDSTSILIRPHQVTVNVYLVDENGNEKLVKQLKFFVRLQVSAIMRMFPYKPNTIIGVFDEVISKNTLSKLKELSQNLDDVTILNGQILLYMESTINQNFVTTGRITLKSSFKNYDESIGKIYIIMPDGSVKVSEFQPVDEYTEEAVLPQIEFDTKGAHAILIPEIQAGVYQANLEMEVYYNKVEKGNYLTQYDATFKLVSYLGDGFLVMKAISLTVPYFIQEQSNPNDYLKTLLRSAVAGPTYGMPVYNIFVGLYNEGYHLTGLIDSGIFYTPMPDTTLTERISGEKYEVWVTSTQFSTNPDLIPDSYFYEKYKTLKRKVLFIGFRSLDKAILGCNCVYKVKRNNTIDVYILRYITIDPNATNEEYHVEAENLQLLYQGLKRLLGNDAYNTNYFPLLYVDDNIIVTTRAGETINNVKYNDYYYRIHGVCITNNKYPPDSFWNAFVTGDPRVSVSVSKEGEYDCAFSQNHYIQFEGSKIIKKTALQTTNSIEFDYLYSYDTMNTNLEKFLSMLSDWWHKLTGSKSEIGDNLKQEDLIKILLYPDNWKASENLAVMNLDTITYQRGEYTVNVHVYSYINYPLDKVRELSKELVENHNKNNDNNSTNTNSTNTTNSNNSTG